MSEGGYFFMVPSCKPLRLIEWFTCIICFTLMFFTRCFTLDQLALLTTNEIIYLFITFGTFILVTGGDVLSQLIKDPVSNIPMILVAILGTVFTFIAGVVLTLSYNLNKDCPDRRILNTICLISGGAYFMAVVYLIDAIILIRFTTLPKVTNQSFE